MKRIVGRSDAAAVPCGRCLPPRAQRAAAVTRVRPGRDGTSSISPATPSPSAARPKIAKSGRTRTAAASPGGPGRSDGRCPRLRVSSTPLVRRPAGLAVPAVTRLNLPTTSDTAARRAARGHRALRRRRFPAPGRPSPWAATNNSRCRPVVSRAAWPPRRRRGDPGIRPARVRRRPALSRPGAIRRGHPAGFRISVSRRA